jgi:hypothetical protein
LIDGIEDVNSDADVLVYPNPSDGNFIVEFANGQAADHASIKVYNTLGQLIFSSKEKINDGEFKKEIHLCDEDRRHCAFSNGVYFIEITASDVFARKKITVMK